jgi:hypothetical protein
MSSIGQAAENAAYPSLRSQFSGDAAAFATNSSGPTRYSLRTRHALQIGAAGRRGKSWEASAGRSTRGAESGGRALVRDATEVGASAFISDLGAA